MRLPTVVTAALALALATAPGEQTVLAQGAPPGAAGKQGATKKDGDAARPVLKRPIKLIAPAPDAKGDAKKDAKGDAKKDAEPAKEAFSGRWTHPIADDMIDLGVARAAAGGDDAVAGLLVAAAMRESAAPDKLTRAFAGLTKRGGEIANEARMLGLFVAPTALPKPWEGWAQASFTVPTQSTGIVRAFTIVGPFQDNGGGLDRHEGPEAQGASYDDATADYSWGDFEVKPRPILPETVTAQGLPLDLYIHPRTESCTYLASRVAFPSNPKSVVLRVASTGSVRLVWDGATVASDEEVHSRAILDRMAVAIEPTAGPHVVAVKVCSSPLPDEGRVRVRFTDETGAPLAVDAAASFDGVAKERLRSNDAPGKAAPPAPSPKPAAGGAPASPKPGSDPKAAPGSDPKAAPTAQKPAPTAPKAAPAAPKPAPKSAGPKKAIALPPGVKKVDTLLGRALSAGTSGTKNGALIETVARALGGADDTRSPRAPGLLDRVAKDPTVTPDELALAGWLSSFGANKSGWLRQAADRGRASQDDDTASFALRRLAEAEVAKGSLDWALRTLGEAPLATANDLGARMLRISVRARAGGQTATIAALEEMRALDAEAGAKFPIAGVRELAAFAVAKPELKLAYARRLASLSNTARDPSLAYASGIEGSAAVELAAAKIVSQQTNVNQLIDLGRALLRWNRNAWAREVLFTATRLSPNKSDAWDGLAAAREAVMLDERNTKAQPTDDEKWAQAARKRALDLKRGDPTAKAEIAFREGAGPGTKKTAKDGSPDERFLVDTATIVDRAKKNPAKVGTVFERQLHFQRVVTYHEDKRVSQLIHQAREIVVEPRTQAELYEHNIPAEGDQVELVFARVIRKDGTVVPPDEQSASGAYIKWPELKQGDIVEYAVRSWTSMPVGRRGDPPFYFIDYVGSSTTRPVMFNEVVVDSPEGSPLGVDVVHGKADKEEDKVENGRRIVRLAWDHPPNVPDEPFAPGMTEVLPLVVGSTFRSWDEFREWYKTAITGMTEPDDQIKRVAAELTKGKKTDKEKLEALFNYVADDVRYVNYTSGEYWLPNRPQQCLARKQGDCDDKAILLITLLRAIGIEATPVLVQTRLTAMPSALAGTKAAVPLFDHGIAFLPGKNGKPGTWLDATSPQSRLGPLPSMDARARGIFVYEGEAKIIETPSSSPDDHGVAVDWTIQLAADGAAHVKGNEKHIGDWAFELRNNLVEPDARAQWVEQYLSRWFATVDLAPEIAYAPDAGTLGYTLEVEGFGRPEGDELAVSALATMSFMSTFASLPVRTLPVVLPPQLGPSHQNRKIHLVAPEGWTFEELPPGGEAKGGAFGHAKVAYKQGKAGSVDIEAEVVFDKSTIPVAEYPAYRKWLESVDALMRQSVRLKKSSPVAKP
ncbi:MAG TPA: transglutaminase domain-containing protein [Polyangiaceae bacterium]|nr:transglutaminase domain-containing protein [Polyangiaceae bacterium]